MQPHSDLIHRRHSLKHLPTLNKSLLKFILLISIFAIATPVLADYLGPDRVRIETVGVCKVVLYQCRYVPAKDDWRYTRAQDWSCSNANEPWQEFPAEEGQECFEAAQGDKYWVKEDTAQEVTNTYPPATISSSLQNCSLQNGWCGTSPQLSLSGSEPVLGQNIIAIEGTLNGQTFACSGANCSIALNEGNNNLTYWALSSWGDSSTMGTFTTKVDTGLPDITGSFTGTLGSNDWYITPVSFTGTASDEISGLAGFTCTLDGLALGSCNSINVNNEGAHTIILTARDNAGRTRTISQNASLDTQNPVLNAALGGMLGANTWYTAAELNASASDPVPGSGLAALDYKLDGGSWLAFPASGVLNLPDGRHSLELRAVDNAGRTVSSSESFWLDTVPPELNLSPSGTPGSNTWYTTDVNLTASASDSTSGVDLFEYSLEDAAWSTYSTPLTLADGTHGLSFWAQDAAGLVTQVDRTYKVDTRAPQIGGSLSGVPGTNGWYISDVKLSASASDPAPGSGIDAFTYILNEGAESPYANTLTLFDGQNTIQLNAQDKAGWISSTEQIIRVDTTYPSLNVHTALPDWIQNSVTLNGSAGDNGSGLLRVEISTDAGQTWQPVTGTTSWSYTWNTQNSPNGIHDVQVRAIDNAGLTTKRSFYTGVDNRAPKISVPDSWYQWDTVTLNVWDADSGLSEARVEISDPEGRWPTRIIRLNPGRFPLEFKWDRRFGNDTIAPLGTYDLKVVAFDKLGNQARKSASINILLGILPAGPTATLQPSSRPADASTPTPYQTVTPTASSISTTETQTAVVSTFGLVEPTSQVTSTPTSSTIPRAIPTQTGLLDWLQSIFVPGSNNAETVTEVGSSVPLSASQSSSSQSNVLWGAAAAGVIGAATAYALEEKRKRKEEEARQAEQVKATVDAKNEAIQASRQAQRDALKIQNWLQGQATLDAQIEEAKKQGATSGQISALKQLGATQGIGAALNSAANLAQSLFTSTLNRTASANIRIARKEALVEEEMKALGAKPQEWESGYNAYMAQKATQDWRAGEKEIYAAPPKEKTWWDNTKSFMRDEIIQPLLKPAVETAMDTVTKGFSLFNENVYQPLFRPAVEKTNQFVIDQSAWVNEYIYQPFIKPVVEKTRQFVIDQTAWINENIYQPHIKPALEKTRQFVIDQTALINENIYQPHIKPALEKTRQLLINDAAWINENIYQPYIQPVLMEVKEKVYQPYIEPFLDKSIELMANDISWINQNIYQPVFAPVVNDINQYIYQPLVKKVTDWWGEYGEWVHGALDVVGFIPGAGEIADGINGVIYFAEGRYLEASLSAVSAIPVLGYFGQAGKLTLKAGQEVVDKVVGTVAKELVGEAIQKAAKDSLEQVAEKTAKKSGEWVHTVLEVAGCIPGAGTTSSSLNGLIQLGKGRFLDSTMSAISMVPIVGGIVSTGKEIVDSSLKRIINKAADEMGERAAKEVGEELAEKTTKGMLEEFIEKTINKTKKKLKQDAFIERTRESDNDTDSTTVREELTLEKTQLTSSLREQYGKEVLEIVQKHGDDAIGLINKHGKLSIEVMGVVAPKEAEKLLKTLDNDVLDYVIQQGNDAVEALSYWSEKDLREHGVELALRAKMDAKVLADVKSLIELGPIDPKNLTKKQQKLISAIAANSTQYADEGQVVLGKWVDQSNGFVEHAQDTGSIHYNPHSAMWDRLGVLGKQNQEQVAWLINQQVVQTAVDKGLPIEYTLNGIPGKSMNNEHAAIEAIFSGKTDAEIMLSLRKDYMPIRMKELQELQKAGYELAFDEVSNSYVLIPSEKGKQT